MTKIIPLKFYLHKYIFVAKKSGKIEIWHLDTRTKCMEITDLSFESGIVDAVEFDRGHKLQGCIGVAGHDK